MIDEIHQLLNQYSNWLKDQTTLREVADWFEVTTPYLDRHNDYLQIYIKRDNDGFVLTDDSYIIEDLINSGCELDSKKRKDIIQLTLNGFGVKREENRLMIHAVSNNFAAKKHNLVQAMLAINDLFYLAKPTIKSLFLEDVAIWLDTNDIRNTPRVNFRGKTEYDHMFDFVIPASKKQPERIIETINVVTKDTTEALVFAWIDTKDTRPPNAKAYAFLNDSTKFQASSINALHNYHITPVRWSERERVKAELAA